MGNSLLDKVLDKFSKKELVAWFIIFDLICIIIGLITWKFSSAKEIIDQVSFAAGICSILLALLAIVYAFFQSNNSSEQYSFLRANINKIEQEQTTARFIAEILTRNNDDLRRLVSEEKSEDVHKEKIIQKIDVAQSVLNNILRPPTSLGGRDTKHNSF